MKDNIQGNISIRISNDEMTAYLDFVPGQVLTEWSDEIILKLLKEAGVTKGFKEFHFSRIYSKIVKLENSESFEIAKGLEPEIICHGNFSIKNRELPHNLKTVYENILDNSDDPEVYIVDDEKNLEIEPQKLSFVVLKYFYVEAGDVVAVYDDDAKPKPGYTVTGKELAPKESDDELPFCVSKDFSIKDGKVKAKINGFVRAGKNWIDIMEFKGYKLSIEPADDYSEYYLSFTPGSEDSPLPEYDDILLLISDKDYPFDRLKDEKSVIGALKKAVAEKRTIKISLSKKIEPVAVIDINPSKTKAVLKLSKGCGAGGRLTLKSVGALIRESKIKGMNLDSLKKEILDFYKSKKLEFEYLCVEGKSATRGEPRRLKYLKEFISVDKIEDIVNRINDETEAFYSSFKEFRKENISSAIKVSKGFEFAVLTEPVDGDDGVDIYGKKIKGLVGNDPIIETFENIIIKQDKFISKIDGILDLSEEEGKTQLRIREHKDMFVDVTVAKDAMSASFTFYREEGSGEPASLEFIKKQIDESGVVQGINDEIVEDSFKRFQAGELISEVEFARGQVPTDKKSSRIKYYNQSGKSKFNYEIEKGAKIAKIFPSKKSAEDGFDVLGTVMESSGVISLDLNLGDYILEEKQDDGSIILISDINGELKVDDTKIEIIDKKVLATDVSVKTGSIKTLCSLIVKGSVMSSLYVVSGGNIKIHGTVQGALISADKNIIINQGVKGEDKAVLRAKEKVDVKFIEKGNVMAVDDVHIRKAALHSKIISNGKIVFDKAGTKIVGGQTFAKKGLAVDEAGSPSGSKTLISFGQDYLVADKIKVFEKDVDKIQEDLMKIDQFLGKSKGLSQDKITHLRKQKVFLMKKLEKKNMKLFLLREKFEEHARSEIIIRNRIHPGVVFESHGRKLEIMEEQHGCKIIFDLSTGQIEKRI